MLKCKCAVLVKCTCLLLSKTEEFKSLLTHSAETNSNDQEICSYTVKKHILKDFSGKTILSI